MNTVGDGVDAAGRLVGSLKDLPLWILASLAVSADILFFLPIVKAKLPDNFLPWLIVGVVLFNTLAFARVASLGLRAWNRYKTALAARRTFHISPDAHQSWWSTARQRDDSKTTQISVRLLVKNLTSAPLGLSAVRLIKPKIGSEIIQADVLLRAADSNMYGTTMHSGHKIPPKDSLPASVHLMIRGVPNRAPGEILNVVIGISDDEGNEQRLKISLRGLGEPKTRATASARETIFSITDPVEKEIVSVLQAELDRYDKHGRERGGLGSIHIVYRGRAISGVGTDSWNPDSPKNQSIAEDPDAATLESDNLAALMAFHDRMRSTPEKERLAAVLIDRLDGKKPYLRVSYFIVAALWKIGRLKDALSKAYTTLPENDIKSFGLSNVLLMFNGLLKYRHPDFTTEMLEWIENLVHQLKEEHTFQITEKIAAVRAYRLRPHC